jgi:hypothetical protein
MRDRTTAVARVRPGRIGAMHLVDARLNDVVSIVILLPEMRSGILFFWIVIGEGRRNNPSQLNSVMKNPHISSRGRRHLPIPAAAPFHMQISNSRNQESAVDALRGMTKMVKGLIQTRSST